MSRTETSIAQVPRSFLRPCVLLLLREQPSHGYELLERLGVLGFTRADPGGLYRTLRALEREGLVHSSWERSSEGPDRRIYELTRHGMEELHDAAKGMARSGGVIGLFLSRYGEFASLAPDELAAIPRR
ncbi:Transcriptional regulator PadR-like family [Gaiella occulta]|uniref:Transcriptional regulator PadR-like family n=1 Tax=Gaiella occulta TaxID=1002870 RepID=A0A7M2Z0L2_9ACTN|nr:helix-turn-helix transcriptional regulator [Gaiella occulta]RDI75831.1 Transcriptional regulator PadR-like family [Gaiella occulta]